MMMNQGPGAMPQMQGGAGGANPQMMALMQALQQNPAMLQQLMGAQGGQAGGVPPMPQMQMPIGAGSAMPGQRPY